MVPIRNGSYSWLKLLNCKVQRHIYGIKIGQNWSASKQKEKVDIKRELISIAHSHVDCQMTEPGFQFIKRFALMYST